jgi:K+/H+ antiporter YhaU regulatory subunit KhtT
MKVINVRRHSDNLILPLPSVVLHAGDHLIVQDTPDRLKEFEKVLEATLYPQDSEDKPVDEENPLKAENQQIAEVVVTEGSLLHGRTISTVRFADRYGLIILALHTAALGVLPIAISAPYGALLISLAVVWDGGCHQRLSAQASNCGRESRTRLASQNRSAIIWHEFRNCTSGASPTFSSAMMLLLGGLPTLCPTMPQRSSHPIAFPLLPKWAAPEPFVQAVLFGTNRATHPYGL